jgi:hypothetical protein
MSPAIKASVIILSIVYTSGSVFAETFARSVSSGRSVRMHQYTSWRESDCSSVSGVVQLLSKPQHGKLTTSETDVTLAGPNRFTGSMKCAGRPVHVFEVYYESNVGFHGADSFSIDATYGARRRVIDHYTVHVQ